MPYAECSECNRSLGSDVNDCETIHRAESNSRIAPLCCECAQNAKSKNRYKGSALIEKWAWTTSACQPCKKRKYNKCKGLYKKRTLSSLCVCGLTEREHDLMQFEKGLDSVVTASTTAELSSAVHSRQQHAPGTHQQPHRDHFLANPTVSPPPANAPLRANKNSTTITSSPFINEDGFTVDGATSSLEYVDVPLVDATEAVKESKALAQKILAQKLSEQTSNQDLNRSFRICAAAYPGHSA